MDGSIRHASEPETPVRRLVVISSIAFSIGNFCGPLIESMIAAGIEVYALAPDYDEKTRRAVMELGAQPIDMSMERTGMHVARDVVDTVRLVRLLHRLKPDLAFSYFIKPVIYGSLAAKITGISRRYAMVAGLGYVYTDSGTGVSVKRRVLKAAASVLYKIAFKVCDRVFFLNDDDVAEFLNAGVIEPHRVLRLTGSGVDLERWQFVPPQQEAPTFLLMARLLREKGICEYVAAARIVRRAHPGARFVLLGGVDSNPGGLTADQVVAWVREGVIEWPGHVDDVRPWVERSSVYVLPSYREGKPRSTQEAMAIGRAVITTDVPGCRDTVEDGVNGFLVPPRDPEALAAAMLRFIEEPSLIAAMGAESRRLAEERFDVHRINRVILDAMGIPFVRRVRDGPSRRTAAPASLCGAALADKSRP